MPWRRFSFLPRSTAAKTAVTIGPAPSSRAIKPESTRVSAMNMQPKVPTVRKSDRTAERSRSGRRRVNDVLFVSNSSASMHPPAETKRRAAKKSGDAPSSRPMRMARKVLPKIRQTSANRP
jgi:hypothetical protein